MRDRDGFSGYETKTAHDANDEGGRSLWWSAGVSLASRIYLVESVVDAMSHAQMTGDREAGYIATGGQISAKQLGVTGCRFEARPRAWRGDCGGIR